MLGFHHIQMIWSDILIVLDVLKAMWVFFSDIIHLAQECDVITQEAEKIKWLNWLTEEKQK